MVDGRDAEHLLLEYLLREDLYEDRRDRDGEREGDCDLEVGSNPTLPALKEKPAANVETGSHCWRRVESNLVAAEDGLRARRRAADGQLGDLFLPGSLGRPLLLARRREDIRHSGESDHNNNGQDDGKLGHAKSPSRHYVWN